MRALKLLTTVIGMHLIGSCILSGFVLGPSAILSGIVLSFFGFYFIPLELVAIFAIWAFYNPRLEKDTMRIFRLGFITSLIGATVISPLIPKEENSEKLYWIGSFVGGFCAVAFAFFCIHRIKRNEQKIVKNV